MPTPFHDIWVRLGGITGILGLPVSDVIGTPDGIGAFMHFEHGSIYELPGSGVHEVHGSIRDKWSSLGWEVGFLGYPLTDEFTPPDRVGRFNHFQHGSIYWTPSTGAHEVHGAIRDKWVALGWEKSLLGYPIGDEEDAPGGRVSRFQNGRIEWNRATGAVTVVNTAIRGHVADVR